MEFIKLYFIPKFFFWLLLSVAGTDCIITNIEVPLMVVIEKEGSSTPILKCNYDLDENHSSLVVKWYKDDQAVYQWIKGRNPTVFPLFRDKVKYEESEDTNHEYSNLALIEPDINLTGVYKCIVQTAKETFMKEQKMQIIDVSNFTLKVYQKNLSNGTYIECSVNNVYPEPMLEIRDNAGSVLSEASQTVNEEENGYFGANLIVSLEDDEVMSDDYICSLYFKEFSLRFTKNLYSNGGICNRKEYYYYKLLLLQILFIYVVNFFV